MGYGKNNSSLRSVCQEPSNLYIFLVALRSFFLVLTTHLLAGEVTTNLSASPPPSPSQILTKLSWTLRYFNPLNLSWRYYSILAYRCIAKEWGTKQLAMINYEQHPFDPPLPYIYGESLVHDLSVPRLEMSGVFSSQGLLTLSCAYQGVLAMQYTIATEGISYLPNVTVPLAIMGFFRVLVSKWIASKIHVDPYPYPILEGSLPPSQSHDWLTALRGQFSRVNNFELTRWPMSSSSSSFSSSSSSSSSSGSCSTSYSSLCSSTSTSPSTSSTPFSSMPSNKCTRSLSLSNTPQQAASSTCSSSHSSSTLSLSSSSSKSKILLPSSPSTHLDCQQQKQLDSISSSLFTMASNSPLTPSGAQDRIQHPRPRTLSRTSLSRSFSFTSFSPTNAQPFQSQTPSTSPTPLLLESRTPNHTRCCEQDNSPHQSSSLMRNLPYNDYKSNKYVACAWFIVLLSVLTLSCLPYKVRKAYGHPIKLILFSMQFFYQYITVTMLFFHGYLLSKGTQALANRVMFFDHWIFKLQTIGFYLLLAIVLVVSSIDFIKQGFYRKCF